MSDKMKSRRRVALRSAPRATFSDRRRDFFKDILQRVQDLPDDQRLPDSIQDDIRAYSRSQNSEKPIVRVSDYPVGAVKHVFSVLLENLDGNMGVLVNDLLRDIRLNDESLRYLPQDAQWKLKLDKLLQEKNISTLSMDQLRTEVASLFDQEEENVLEPLFQSSLSEGEIKNFLVSSSFVKPDGQVSLRYFVARFLEEHRFDLIRDLFQKGFQPTSPEDWANALPPSYYEKFPKIMWKLTEWEQFRPFVELSKHYSLDLDEYIKYSFYRKHERLIRMGQEIRPEKRRFLRPSPHAAFITIYDKNEMELLQRVRPWVDGLVSVLIKPVQDCDQYLGKPYGKNYYFPTDTFFKDLANPPTTTHSQKGRLFSIQHEGMVKTATMHVFHLLQNGKIVPQTMQEYEKGVDYVSSDHSPFRIPRVEEYFLSLPFTNMSPVDQDILKGKATNDLSFFLSTIFDEQLDFDSMASLIITSIFEKHQTLRECLQGLFQVFFLVSPRYNMELVSSVFKDRLNMFFYNLENLDELPVDFYYPSYHFMGQEKQGLFDRWRSRCMEYFITESLYFLLMRNYPVLHIKAPPTASSSPPKSILLHVEVGDKLSLLHPYHEKYIYLPGLADSLLQDQEYLVDGSPLTVDFSTQMETFYHLERVRAGLGSLMMDNEFELEPTAPTVVVREVETFQELESLPDFKEKAYQFLELLSASS